MHSFKVADAEAGQRADIFVAAKYPNYSRASLKQLFSSGLVEVGKKKAKASQKLAVNKLVRVDDRLLTKDPGVPELEVIYEDDDVVVMNKPAGLLTHSKGALNLEPTVASFLKTKLSDKSLNGNRAGIVHRLDRPTSGVIIGAKTELAQKFLQKQFSNRKVAKTYLAVVEGIPEPPAALIDAPIGRNPKKPQTFRVDPNAKRALTEYRTLRTFKKANSPHAVLELKPTTGRTHQLRVHLAYIGHPVVGDELYGVGGPGLMLHAKSLEINLPNGGRRIFEVPTRTEIEDFSG